MVIASQKCESRILLLIIGFALIVLVSFYDERVLNIFRNNIAKPHVKKYIVLISPLKGHSSQMFHS